MGRKRTPGLQKRQGIWYIDKRISGHRVCESTCTSDLEEAERHLARRIDLIRQAEIYGVRPKRTFAMAAAKYSKENQHKRSIRGDESRLRIINHYISDIPIDKIHMGTLQGFINARRAEGKKTRTINLALSLIRRILNLAATEWIDEAGLTWLSHVPKIKLLPEWDLRKPYPLNWEEQRMLFDVLPTHLKKMALFAVNTGCRDREICQLRWEWEHWIPELETSIFVVPPECVKNNEARLIVLNQLAKKVIDEVRGDHAEFVFTFRGKPILRMLNSGWKTARLKAGLPQVRVHDLKHTFGRRLRAAGVSFEDRQDLLGHKSARITTHYSAAELGNLLEAANRVCEVGNQKPALTLIRYTSTSNMPCHAKFTQACAA